MLFIWLHEHLGILFCLILVSDTMDLFGWWSGNTIQPQATQNGHLGGIAAFPGSNPNRPMCRTLAAWISIYYLVIVYRTLAARVSLSMCVAHLLLEFSLLLMCVEHLQAEHTDAIFGSFAWLYRMQPVLIRHLLIPAREGVNCQPTKLHMDSTWSKASPAMTWKTTMWQSTSMWRTMSLVSLPFLTVI